MEDKKNEWSKTMARGEHEDTYVLFLNLTKWTAIGCAALLLFLLVFVYQ